MRILISNDDGIDAPGLASLAAAVVDLGDVTVVAPDSAQSGAGHGITVHHPLTVERHDLRLDVDGRERIVPGMSVDGRPADCVRIAVKTLMREPIDLVLSGINQGANDGICVFYSGTVAAAAEGAILGIPAVAFSAKLSGGSVDFARAASYCRSVLATLLDVGLVPGDLVNVNIPNLHKPGWPKGIRVTRMSTAELKDEYALIDESPDQRIYKLTENYTIGDDTDDSDSIAVQNGYITVTPLHTDMTRRDRVTDWGSRSWPLPSPAED